MQRSAVKIAFAPHRAAPSASFFQTAAHSVPLCIACRCGSSIPGDGERVGGASPPPPPSSTVTGKHADGADAFIHHASTEEPRRDYRSASDTQTWAPNTARRRDGLGDAAAAGATSRPGSATSTLHRAFMGTSTRFRNPYLDGGVSITRQDLVNLEREYLAHSPARSVNDHICIAMTRLLRWVADRVFRERYIHRATMLVPMAPAAAAAGSVAAYLRMMLCPKRLLDAAPYVHPASSVAGRGVDGTASRKQAAASSALPHEAARRRRHFANSYADELRGLVTQSECHALHYQILLNMADVTAVERGLVLVLQLYQFSVFLAIFLLYPRMGFRLMGYMAEEASVVWTQMINDIDLGKIAELHVPELALSYWGLQDHFTPQEALVPATIPRRPSTAPALAVVTGGESDGTRGAAAPATSPASVGGQPSALPSTEQRRAAAEGSAALLPEGVPTDEAAAPSSGTVPHTLTEHSVPPPPPPPPQSRHSHRSPHAHVAAGAASGEADRLTLRDVVLLIRSDEMVFRDLNHRTADSLDKGPREAGVIATYFKSRGR